MTKWKTWLASVVGSSAILLAACSQPPLPPPNSGRHSPTAMVEAIRAAGAKDQSVVQVAPLRDPAVDGYLDHAHADVQAGKYRDALNKIDAALKLSPDAPDILQFRAEVEILLRDYSAADADARRSFALGPKVGGLCASNWQTVLEIAESKNDQAGIQFARKGRDACHKAGPVRM
ncbi:MAG: tetratricopeptide repeat protein [Rhodanobacteraceae bacterium]